MRYYLNAIVFAIMYGLLFTGCNRTSVDYTGMVTNYVDDSIPVFDVNAVIDTGAVGTYRLRMVDINNFYRLRPDGTYSFHSAAGMSDVSDKGTWRKEGNRLFLKPYPFKSYYMMQYCEKFSKSYLSVYDLETGEVIEGEYKAYGLFGLKKTGIADSKTALYGNIKLLEVSNTNYDPVRFSMKGRKKQKIEVFLAKKRYNVWEVDNVCIYPDRIVLKSGDVYKREAE